MVIHHIKEVQVHPLGTQGKGSPGSVSLSQVVHKVKRHKCHYVVAIIQEIHEPFLEKERNLVNKG